MLQNTLQLQSSALDLSDPPRLPAGLNTPLQIDSRVYNGLAFFVLAPNFTADGAYTAKLVDSGQGSLTARSRPRHLARFK